MLLLSLVLADPVAAGAPPAGDGSYPDLVQLLDEFLAFRDPAGDRARQIIRDRAGQATVRRASLCSASR
jgi:hypothetical protein